jgi:GNAT superfamily N-acetyltransferase
MHLREALRLVEKVFYEFDAPYYDERGVKSFLHFISFQNMSEMLEKKEILFYGAYEGNEMIRVVALRGDQHLSLLFVRKEHHRKGVAKKLFRLIVAICKERALKKNMITVNASPYAVEIYKRLGFAKLEEEKIKNGIRYTPMAYMIKA